MCILQYFVFIALLISLGDAILCPRGNGCSDCKYLSNKTLQIDCSCNTSDSIFTIKYTLRQLLRIDCHNSANWTEFHLEEENKLIPPNIIYFRRCRLPEGGKLGAITRQMTSKTDGIRVLSLELSNDLTWMLSRETLAEFKDLETLTLSGNELKNVTADLLHDLKNLTILNLRQNDLHELPRGFLNSDNLRSVELGSNTLEVIEPETFEKVENLETLGISNNKLVEIKPHSFDKLKSLRAIQLFTNNLQTLPEDIFAELQSLTVINLSQNNFSAKSLPATLLRNNSRLEMVHFFENKHILTTLPSKFFANLTKLWYVNIRGNKLVYLPEDLFAGSVRLRNLNMEWNYIEKLPRDIFRNCTELLAINLSHNELRNLPDEVFSMLNKLKRLNLANNHITMINEHTFKGLSSLSVLSMERNALKTIHENGLQHLQNLEIAQFSFNQLTLKSNSSGVNIWNDRSGSPFSPCTKIKELHLANNNIFDIFFDWTVANNLTTLNLTHNSLQLLEKKDILFVSKNVYVDLSFNHIETISLADIERKTEIIGACAGVALLGILLLMIVALYCRFQQEIKVWLYAKQRFLWFITENEMNKNKLYDAFISYSHEDEDFVKDLIAKLEGEEKPFKLCVHYRDWFAGESIPTQITRSVENSRRTVVVLSPNFLDRVWGKREFRTAHNQALSNGRARVIVVLYGDIGPIDQLDPDLKAHVSMNPRVKWGDPWFWEKLKFALLHPEGLIKKKRKKTVVETQHPTHIIADEEIELIEDSEMNGTTTTASNQHTHTLETFAREENENDKLL